MKQPQVHHTPKHTEAHEPKKPHPVEVKGVPVREGIEWKVFPLVLKNGDTLMETASTLAAGQFTDCPLDKIPAEMRQTGKYECAGVLRSDEGLMFVALGQKD